MEEEQQQQNIKRFTGASELTTFFISINSDDMEAYIQVLGSGLDLTMDDIVAGIREMKITRGVSRKVVDAILEGKHGKEPILFAKGTEPKDGKDGYFEFFFRTELEKKPKVLDDGSVDYLNVEWFEIVEENQKLVEYHPATEGVEGVTVIGRKLPAKKGRDLAPIHGKGFYVSEDKLTYYASMGGRIEYIDRTMNVLRLLVVDELSLATGNLEFDGSIQVRGNVGSGVSLKATEDIVIDGFVESAEVECGGSIMFRQGMNASGEGWVKARNYVAGKFFEAVKVDCDGEIQADYFLNCTLFAREQIMVSGKKGSIAGGEAYAMLGFITRNIGNRVGLATYLRVGTNEDILKEQLDTEEYLKKTSKEVNQLKHSRNSMEMQFGKEECLNSDKYNKIANALEIKEALLEGLYEKSDRMAKDIDRFRKAQIVVNNMLYEGVTCELNSQKFVPSQVKNVTVKMIGNRIAVYQNN